MIRHSTIFWRNSLETPRSCNSANPEEALNLIAALTHVVGQTLGQATPLQNSRVFRLAQFRFSHGNAAADGRVILFFYFDAIDTGLMALMLGLRGQAEVARFRLSGGLAANPKHN